VDIQSPEVVITASEMTFPSESCENNTTGKQNSQASNMYPCMPYWAPPWAPFWRSVSVTSDHLVGSTYPSIHEKKEPSSHNALKYIHVSVNQWDSCISVNQWGSCISVNQWGSCIPVSVTRQLRVYLQQRIIVTPDMSGPLLLPPPPPHLRFCLFSSFVGPPKASGPRTHGQKK
jgi:hypothetical protein